MVRDPDLLLQAKSLNWDTHRPRCKTGSKSFELQYSNCSSGYLTTYLIQSLIENVKLIVFKDIYLNSGVTKGAAYLGARLTGQPNIFDTLDKREHNRKRRTIGQALSEKSMQSF